MPIVKTKWTKRLAVTLCTMLLLCAALPVCAFADDVHIFTAYQPFMYFESPKKEKREYNLSKEDYLVPGNSRPFKEFYGARHRKTKTYSIL